MEQYGYPEFHPCLLPGPFLADHNARPPEATRRS